MEYDVLPDSYIIPDPKFQKLGGSPVSSDGVSEVWPGVDEEDNSIAIRVIHYRDAGDVREIKKVGHFDLFSPRSSLSIRRTSSERS